MLINMNLIFLSSDFPDVKDCRQEDNNCHSNANCVNSTGSVQCVCRTGYTGNGTVCEGMGTCHIF